MAYFKPQTSVGSCVADVDCPLALICVRNITTNVPQDSFCGCSSYKNFRGNDCDEWTAPQTTFVVLLAARVCLHVVLFGIGVSCLRKLQSVGKAFTLRAVDTVWVILLVAAASLIGDAVELADLADPYGWRPLSGLNGEEMKMPTRYATVGSLNAVYGVLTMGLLFALTLEFARVARDLDETSSSDARRRLFTAKAYLVGVHLLQVVFLGALVYFVGIHARVDIGVFFMIPVASVALVSLYVASRRLKRSMRAASTLIQTTVDSSKDVPRIVLTLNAMAQDLHRKTLWTVAALSGTAVAGGCSAGIRYGLHRGRTDYEAGGWSRPAAYLYYVGTLFWVTAALCVSSYVYNAARAEVELYSGKRRHASSCCVFRSRSRRFASSEPQSTSDNECEEDYVLIRASLQTSHLRHPESTNSSSFPGAPPPSHVESSECKL